MKALKSVAVALAFLAVESATATDAGKERITYSPKNFIYKVNEKGDITGRNTIAITVTRNEPPRGVTRKCTQIKSVYADANLLGSAHIYRIGFLDVDPPKCSFRGTIHGRPFREEAIRAACFMQVPQGQLQGFVPEIESRFRPGNVAELEASMVVGFRTRYRVGEILMGDLEYDPTYRYKLKARVECVASSTYQAQVVGTATLAGGASVASGASPGASQGRGGSSSAGTSVGPLCDLSGTWRLRNTRNNDVSQLIWKIRRLTNEGTAEKRNYEVMRYKDGRRFSPPASGRLYQSAGEALLFYDTPASMPRYNVSRIMSLRRLAVQPGCNAMKQLQIFSSLNGSHAGTVMMFERIRTGANPTVVNPVGKPVIRGQQPAWRQNWKPGIPDNRRQEIERRERQRGR